MYAIRLPNGQFLDTSSGLSLSFELNNQVFSTSSAAILPGSYSFPVDLPLTKRGQEQLGNPQLVTNVKDFQKIENVWVYCFGVPMFLGTLKILSASGSKVKAYIVVDNLAKLKDTPLNELDLGGERGIGGFDENYALFFDAASKPDDYDFTLFPVYCPEFDNTDPDVTANDYINWYFDEEFTFSPDSIALIPFARVDYLLRRIFELLVPEYKFTNAWQTNRELRRLYLLNNYDCRVSVNNLPPIPESQIDLKNHVGTQKSAEFVKAIMSLFCLGLFTSPFSRRIVLRPLRDIVRKPARHDWSQYLLDDAEITDDSANTPMKFCYPQPDHTTDYIDDQIDLPEYSNMQTFQSDLATLTPGLYYILALEQIWGVTDAYGDNTAFYVGRKRRCVVFDGSPELESSLAPAMTYEFPGWGHFPWYEQQGSFWQNDGNDSSPEWNRYKNTFDPQLVFYRGFQESTGAVTHDRPYASNDVWRPDAAPLPTRAKINTLNSGVYTTHSLAQYSLLWSGPYGMYRTWWRDWHDMLRRGKHVTLQFALPVSALIAFSFDEKIRALNMEYIVKKLRIGKTLDRDRLLVEASLISVV